MENTVKYNKELSFTITFVDGTSQRFSTLSNIDTPILAVEFLVSKLNTVVKVYFPDKQIKSISLNIDVI